MSEHGNFISGIYNYCDYVCETCAFTQQCYLYWSENSREEEEQSLDFEFNSLLDNYDDSHGGFGIQDEDFMFEDMNEEIEEQRTQEIIAPSVQIVELLDPVMEKLTEHKHLHRKARRAISLVLENYLLITVKYYRAVHLTNFDLNTEVDQVGLYSYMDTEKTLMALKGFNWNLRFGLSTLSTFYPKYSDIFAQASALSLKIEDRIDSELLPATRLILNKHSHSAGDE